VQNKVRKIWVESGLSGNKPIETEEEYNAALQEFQAKYKEYEKVKVTMDEYKKRYVDYVNRYEAASSEGEKLKYEQEVKANYCREKQEVDGVAQLYQSLHRQVKTLKERLCKYDKSPSAS